jgi:hypothetical protein
VLALFAGGVLRSESSSQSEAQGCRLRKEARRDFYASFEQDEALHHRPMLARMAKDFADALCARTATFGAPAIAAPKTEPGDGG